MGDSSSLRSNSSPILALHTMIPQSLDTSISSAGNSVSPIHQLLLWQSLKEPKPFRVRLLTALTAIRRDSSPAHQPVSITELHLPGHYRTKHQIWLPLFLCPHSYQQNQTTASLGNITPSLPWILSSWSIVWQVSSFQRGVTTLWHSKSVKLKGKSQDTDSTKISFKDIIFERADYKSKV